MLRPNLFDFATSELSQDAIIAWLLSWADEELKSLDHDLCTCSQQLIASLFALHNKVAPGSIDRVEVVTQQDHIDVMCVVNGSYVLVIEDKTATEEHGNQLLDYVEAVMKRNFSRDQILPIYFKTHEQSDFSGVTKHGYKTFSRTDFLKILNECQSGNHILSDFRQTLVELDGRFGSYLTVPPSAWHHQSWIGFYQALKRALGIHEKCWQYVPNPSGGFYGFWWCWLPDNERDCHVYLQLEETKFCFKVGEIESGDCAATRQKWHRMLVEQAPQQGLRVRKPVRFGSGTYMTVAILQEEYRLTDSRGLLDFEQTLAHIKQVETGFREIVRQNTTGTSRAACTSSP